MIKNFYRENVQDNQTKAAMFKGLMRQKLWVRIKHVAFTQIYMILFKGI